MDIDKILKKILQIDDLVSQKHSHSNKNILDSITQALINNWNNAYTHISDTVKHITSTERTNWNDADSKKHVHSNKSILDSISQSNLNNWDDKYTQNEVDNKISQVVSNMDWKESVATYADIATTYPTPDDGWTVNVKDTDITYRYNGSSWIPISANSIPLASSSVDGKMSKQDKIDHDDMNSKKHIHANKSILDTITQALIDGWNSAFTHISDTVKHITSTERSNWNTAYNNNHNHGNKTILDSITQALIDSWNSAFSHISDTIKHITSDERSLWNTVSNKVDKITGKSLSTNDFDNTYKSKIDGISSNANKVEVSTTNGNIKVDGTEKTVYVHPSGTNPHGTTKADVGLSNVDNTSDLNKPISTAVQSALNGKANSSHTHDDRYYTETEADSKFATKDEISTAGYGDMLKSVYDKNGDGVIDNADTVDGKHASDFAPSGYGLGGKGQRLNTSTDLNNIIANGWYDVQNPVNGPYTSGWFNFMVICSGDQSYLTQLGFGMTVNIGHVYIRTKSGSSWSAWIELYSNSVKPSASDVGLSNVDNTSDLNKPISTAVQTALNGKANSAHTHNYAGSSTAGGSANSAVKLDTARKINGINFDGSGDITINAIPSGKTIDGNFMSSFRSQVKGDTNSGDFLASIRNDTANVDSSPQFGSGIGFGRGDTNGYLYMNYSSAFAFVGAGNAGKLNWIKQLAFIDSNVASATRANQDSDGKQINTTYVKKNCTWNDLKGV